MSVSSFREAGAREREREKERERKARLREGKKKHGEHSSAIGDSWEEMRPLQHAHDAVMA